MIKLEKAATKIMAAIGTAVMLFLLFYSWKYTKRLVEPEYYLDEKDSILWNALVGVVLVAVCGGSVRSDEKDPGLCTASAGSSGSCDSSDSRDKACEGRRSGEHCGPVLCAKSSYGTGGR